MKKKFGRALVATLLGCAVLGEAQASQVNFTAAARSPAGVISMRWNSQSNAIYRIDCATGNSASYHWRTCYSNYPSQGAVTFWSDVGNPNLTPPLNFPLDDFTRCYRLAVVAQNDLANAPPITILFPTNNVTLTGIAPAIVTLASPQNVSGVRLFVDGIEAAKAVGPVTSFTFNSCLFANGPHVVFAVADSPNGNCGLSAFTTVIVTNLIQNLYGKMLFSNSPPGGTNVYRAVFADCVNWTFQVTNQAGGVVRTLLGSDTSMRVAWDGTDDLGNALPQGSYGVVVSASNSPAGCAYARNWFVCPTSAGANNGKDWNNAWGSTTNFTPVTDTNGVVIGTNVQAFININWSLVRPGDTIWLAGGGYPQLILSGSGAPSQRIYVKRARNIDFVPYTTPGWYPGMGSTPTINQISCNNPGSGNYITVDGQTPYDGIVITNTSLGETYAVDLSQSGANFIELLNLDIGGVSTLETDFNGEGRCFSTLTPATGLHVAYCRLHGEPTLVLTGNQDSMVWEHNRFYDNVVGNTAAWHPNVWNSVGGDNNCIFRYNDVSNYMTEFIMFSTSNPNTNWQIYANLVHDGTPGQTARILEAQYTNHGPVLLFNNTFVNLETGIRTANGGSWTNCQSINNLFFSAGDPLSYGFGNGADDYIMADTAVPGSHSIGFILSDVFINYTDADYRIVSTIGQLFPAGQGETLGSSYATDFDGNSRGVNGPWSIGAFEPESP